MLRRKRWALLAWLNRLTCPHRQFVFVMNFHGDKINEVSARSLWRCSECGKDEYRGELHP